MGRVRPHGEIPMIERQLASVLRQAAEECPSITLFGPRQSGKTTLAKACFPGYSYANLDGDDLDLSSGIAIRNVRSFRV